MAARVWLLAEDTAVKVELGDDNRAFRFDPMPRANLHRVLLEGAAARKRQIVTSRERGTACRSSACEHPAPCVQRQVCGDMARSPGREGILAAHRGDTQRRLGDGARVPSPTLRARRADFLRCWFSTWSRGLMLKCGLENWEGIWSGFEHVKHHVALRPPSQRTSNCLRKSPCSGATAARRHSEHPSSISRPLRLAPTTADSVEHPFPSPSSCGNHAPTNAVQRNWLQGAFSVYSPFRLATSPLIRDESTHSRAPVSWFAAQATHRTVAAAHPHDDPSMLIPNHHAGNAQKGFHRSWPSNLSACVDQSAPHLRGHQDMSPPQQRAFLFRFVT
jgi:hypothetical protein